MKEFVKNYWKSLLFFALVGLVGGFFTGLFLLDSYPAEIRQELVAELTTAGLGQFPVEPIVAIITAVQSAFYGVALGAAGIWLGKKTGLWKDERTLSPKPLVITALVSLAGGLMMILPDVLFFGRYSQAVLDSYATKPSIVFILASVTYGAVIEEVMLRLFWMSLAVFLLHKLVGRGSDRPSVAVMVFANVITAILFAAGHLPATILLLGDSPMILLRCFLLNGGLGLAFGWLYRKYGLRYAMIAHGGCHVVSKLIWILFL